MSSCDTKTGVCETSATPQDQATSKCHCGGICGGDPIVCKMQMWACSFHAAMKEVQVDILKAKIQKSWGAKLEKEANAVLEVMEAKWKSMQDVEHAKAKLKEKFHEICKEA
ncbi:MAG: hypothetical protein HQL14_08315 [Candidatus Omnitrophica bacterium]|nr:hypothetical protein [Candidatus Omnitrophota bacterium]